jgi:two-component system NtrC family sensor kinase
LFRRFSCGTISVDFFNGAWFSHLHKGIMRFTRSLRFRLLMGSLLVTMVLFGAYSYYVVDSYSDQMMSLVLGSATRVSDFAKRSTHYSMLLNRKEDVYQIINTLGRQTGIEGIRILNKKGMITYSTDSSEIRSVVNLSDEACFVCHEQGKPLESVPSASRTRVFRAVNGHRVLGQINPIRNEEQCAREGCHAHPSEQTVLGVLDVRMSLQEIDAAVSQQKERVVASAVLIALVVAFGSMLFILISVDRPVKKLIEGTRQISEGNLDFPIAVGTSDEIGMLARSFNEMTRNLRKEKEENLHWANTLEERVREKTEELKRIHEQMLQIEKMASLGKLSATVAHELNNPLEGILTYAKLIAKKIRKQEQVSEAQRQILEDLDLVAHEAARCGTIVKNLLLFSKKQVAELSIVPVREVVEKAEQLVRHHFQMSNVQFRATYEPQDVTLLCDANQIQQALVALFMNAVEAMPDGGTVSVDARLSEEHDAVVLSVGDTGVGIYEEDLPHVFEPFFTTKKGGIGVGLGLSVVYGIVERHGGEITAHSTPPSGTTFKMTFKLPTTPIDRRGMHDAGHRNAATSSS